MISTKTAVPVAVIVTLGVCAAAQASSGGVRSLSDPPVKATRHFTLRLAGSASRVTLYAGHFRRHLRADAKLGTTRVRNHKVNVTLPARLAPGAYFIIACPATGGGSCAASKKPTLLLPKLSSVLRNGTATLSSGKVSKPIGESGGTLRATAPGGTLTLKVPPRSLPNSVLARCTFQQQYGFWRRVCPPSTAPTGETIMLTPLKGLSGTGSLGRFVAGAQLRPDGLPLIRGATLTIALKRAIPKAKIVAVAFTGTGRAIHQVPLRVSRGQAIIALGEIGGGVAILERGTAAASSALPYAHAAASAGPKDLTATYGPVIAGIISTLWGSQHDLGDGSGNTADAVTALSSTLDAMYRDIVTQEIPAGLTSDAAAKVAIRDLLDWARTSALLGFDTRDTMSLLVKLLVQVYNRAQERCAQAPGFSPDSIGEIVSAARNLALLGYPLDLSMDELLVCARFTAKFDSTITTHWGGQNHGTHVNEYRAEVLLKPTVDGSRLTGEAPGSYPQTTGEMYTDPFDCDTSGTYVSHLIDMSGTGDIAQVLDFTLPGAGAPPPKLELLLGNPFETYHAYETGCKTDSQNENLPMWTGSFLLSHTGEIDPFAGKPNSYIFSLTPGAGETIATRTYDKTFSGGPNTYTEHTTITVTHTPGKFKRL